LVIKESLRNPGASAQVLREPEILGPALKVAAPAESQGGVPEVESVSTSKLSNLAEMAASHPPEDAPGCNASEDVLEQSRGYRGRN